MLLKAICYFTSLTSRNQSSIFCNQFLIKNKANLQNMRNFYCTIFSEIKLIITLKWPKKCLNFLKYWDQSCSPNNGCLALFAIRNQQYFFCSMSYTNWARSQTHPHGTKMAHQSTNYEQKWMKWPATSHLPFVCAYRLNAWIF